MCAIHGKNFCRSAQNAFNLLMRNIVRVFVLDKVSTGSVFVSSVSWIWCDVKLDYRYNIPSFCYRNFILYKNVKKNMHHKWKLQQSA